MGTLLYRVTNERATNRRIATRCNEWGRYYIVLPMNSTNGCVAMRRNEMGTLLYRATNEHATNGCVATRCNEWGRYYMVLPMNTCYQWVRRYAPQAFVEKTKNFSTFLARD